jgi:23S rRNA (cytosine1962-C5)-methyltransferase
MGENLIEIGDCFHILKSSCGFLQVRRRARQDLLTVREAIGHTTILMIVWRLNKGSDRKFRQGTPWVFSNELSHSPKGIQPGELVDLQDASGAFLGRGYGHPNSLISFRTLTTDSSRTIDAGFLYDRLASASHLRRIAGVGDYSHRLCFAEGDFLPGLVIDRYFLHPKGQVFVVQSSTAGMDKLLPLVADAIEKLVRGEDRVSWADTSIVIANDSKSRLMEGIEVEPKRVLKAAPGFEPENAKLLIQPALAGLEPAVFTADMIGGQKTGFFLDQRSNVKLVAALLPELLKEKREIRVLDLFCYVGQWGTQLSHVATSLGRKAHVTCVDASTKALGFAVKNVEAHGGAATAEAMDVLEALGRIEREKYDVVICDPPAFIKKKKDIPTGTQAYVKVNREAMRKVARGGIFASCSCSGLLAEEEFRGVLARAGAASDRGAMELRWLARGSHGPDHPQRPEFPQGTYLKSWIAVRGD